MSQIGRLYNQLREECVMSRHLKMLIIILLGLSLVACTSHKRPTGAQVIDGNRYHGDGESYTEGLGGGDGSSYAENSKCFPAKCVPCVEQHYFFDFDSNDVRADAMESIKVQADYLVKHPNVKIRLEGNTDDRGSREYNIALGWRRARSVLDVLKQYGVSPSQVVMISYGAEKPAACGEDERSYQCNRRVDLKYSSD